MKQTIESIWQKGFMKDDALIAPKVVDLYNRKSQNIIDKLHRMFDLNNKFIILLSITLLSILSYVGAPLLGGFYAAMLMVFVIFSKKALAELNLINKKVSSYHYLKTFDIWLKKAIDTNTKIYRFFYPAMFVGGLIQARFTDIGESLVQRILTNYPETFFILDIPAYFLLAAACITGLLSYFAKKIYYADMNLVYGNTFNKLDEIINDMETLRE